MLNVALSGITVPKIATEPTPGGGLHLTLTGLCLGIHYSPDEALDLATQLAAALGYTLVPAAAARWPTLTDRARDGGPYADPSTYALELYPLPQHCTTLSPEQIAQALADDVRDGAQDSPGGAQEPADAEPRPTSHPQAEGNLSDAERQKYHDWYSARFRELQQTPIQGLRSPQDARTPQAEGSTQFLEHDAHHRRGEPPSEPVESLEPQRMTGLHGPLTFAEFMMLTPEEGAIAERLGCKRLGGRPQPTAITIPGAPGRWQETTARYDYATAKGHCPICGGVGWLWRGYFSCDSVCHAIAVVEDGRTFLPVPEAREG
jgi:hypothetical protein